MAFTNNYHNGLLYLAHLIITADGVVDENELKAMENLRKEDNIPEDVFLSYKTNVLSMKEKDIYQKAIDLISLCNDEEKLRAFSWLYKISEVDGFVHVKEVRFLLYSIKRANLEFEDVVEESKAFPSII